MLLKSIRMQLGFILRQRTTQLVLFLFLGLVGYNFINNVLQFQGMDVSNMYHPMKMLTLSYNRVYYNADITLLFAQIYPLLVACPAGLALAKEAQMQIHTLIVSRIGRAKYIFTKGISVFCSTMLVFTLPFLMEILLNVITFPIDATQDFSHLSFYDPNYIQNVQNYWFADLYQSSPYLYAVIMTLLFGAFSGMLGLLVMSFSAIFPVRFRVLYLILPFTLLNSTIYILPELTGGTMQHVWYKYLLIFADGEKNTMVFLSVLSAILVFTSLAAVISCKKDSI